MINCEVIDSEPAGHRSTQGRGFDPIPMTRLLQVSAEIPTAVRRIGQHTHRCGLTGQKLRRHCGVVAADAAGLGQGTVGDDAGIGLDRDVGFEPVLAAVHALMGMTGLGIDRGDHPIRRDSLGDTPPPVGAIGILDRFDILAGDQRQQRHRLGTAGTEFLVGQMTQQPVGIGDQASTNISRALASSQVMVGLPGSS